MASILSRLFGGKKKSTAKVIVTSINLKFMGNAHGIDGMEVNEPEFEVNIPFQNKMGSGLLPDNLKGPSMKITKITIAEPFKLVEVAPALPVDVPYLSKTMFKVKVLAPDMKYEGPLSINFGNESTDSVVINIKKVMLHYKDRSMELEDSSIGTTMQKSQVFKEGVQIYKVVSLGDTVNSVTVSKPFEVVSTDPKLPITANTKDSYIISIYFKSPDFSYAGDLDITFS